MEFQRNASGTIDGTIRARWNANDVVPIEQSLGRIDGWLDLEPESPTHVALSHGIPSLPNATTTLSGNFVESSQSSEEFEIKQEV